MDVHRGRAVTREPFRRWRFGDALEPGARDHPRGDAVIGAGRDDRPIVTEQPAEARGLGHGFLLQLSAVPGPPSSA